MKIVALKEEQFVTNASGKRVGVLMNLRTYERLREAAEELADVRAYDAARPRAQAEVESGQCVTLAAYQTSRARRRK